MFRDGIEAKSAALEGNGKQIDIILAPDEHEEQNPILIEWDTIRSQNMAPESIESVLKEEGNSALKAAVLLHQKLRISHIVQALSDKDKYVVNTAERLHPFKSAYARVFKMHSRQAPK